MKKPDTILDEIHAIRYRLYEITKDLTTSERTAHLNRRAETVAEFKIVASAKDKE